MNEEMKKMLEEISARECWDDSDDSDFIVDDYAGGNVDDAYSGGYSSGYIQLARELLTKFGS